MAIHRNELAREIFEALAIDAKKDECVSVDSIALHPKQNMYLRGAPHEGNKTEEWKQKQRSTIWDSNEGVTSLVLKYQISDKKVEEVVYFQ